MSVKNKTLRAFLHQNQSPTVQETWDEAWNYQKARLQRAEARVAELEEGLHGIANCAYGYSHPKAPTADEAASWMNGEAMRLLGDTQSSAWLLRKQAEARVAELESREDAMCDLAYANGAKQGFSLGQMSDNAGLDQIVAPRYSSGIAELKRLRQQSDELER